MNQFKRKPVSRRRQLKKAINRNWGSFFRCYHQAFSDKRIRRRFEGALRGLLAAQTPKVQRMAAASCPQWDKASSTAKAIYRFLANGQFAWDDLLLPLYRKTKQLFAAVPEVVGIIDLSPLEKPYARKMEALCQVYKHDGGGTTRGYMSISVLLVGAGRTGLGYFKVFSHQAELMSQNQEIACAIASVRRLLAPRVKIIWVWDRGFDDAKNYQKILSQQDQFVGRVHHNRLVTIDREECGLLSWGRGLPPGCEFAVKLSFWRRRRRLRIGLRWGEFQLAGHRLWLLRAQILGIEGLDVSQLEEQEWWLVTSLRINSAKVARQIWHYYRRRWQIETFYKFMKVGLGMEEFQILRLEAIRRLVSLIVIAGMFIYTLSVSTDDEPIRLLLHLGGWTGRDRPGKWVLKRGLAIFLSYLYVDARLRAHEFR